MIRRACILWMLLAAAAAAFEVDCPSAVPEGEAFFVTVSGEGDASDLRVRWLEREFHPQVEYRGRAFTARVLLGMGMRERLEGSEHRLEVRQGRHMARRSIRRQPKDFPEQHLEVESRYSELSAADLARHEEEQAAVRAALERLTPERRWSLPLRRPVPGEKTGDFGLRRFFNGEPKKPHSGSDLSAAAGDTVVACADGVVSLAGDHFFAGHSVYLDHGEGVTSMIFHLSEILVEEGQILRRGQPLGLAGATGRVTGPHVHWGLSLQGQLVDPLMLSD